jgi:gliding motility-associated-like protein
MRKIIFLLCVVFIARHVKSQDLALASPSGTILAPVSGCGLTAAETVTVRIFNFGPTLVSGNTFNVSYTIDGGAATTELVTLTSNFATNSSFTYNFLTTADLSVAGTHTIDATVTLAGDVTSSNDTYSGYTVINNSNSIGGTISGGGSVCITTNTGNLTLSGNTGNVLNWEYSTDGGSTWLSLSNTTTTQSYTDVSTPTLYRAKVQNATCTAAFSDTASLTIDQATVAGSVSGSATKCISGNSGTLTSTGRTGTILNWEFSTNGGASFTPNANTATTQSYTNLVTTTRYRVKVQNGSCPSATSTSGTITISPLSVGGTIASDDTVCAGNNGGTLSLSGQTGSISWQVSTNGGTSFAAVSPANTSTSLTYTNLVATRLYRARVTSGGCTAQFSDTVSIVVSAATVAGSVTTNTTVCGGNNSGTLNLGGQNGSVTDWESSTDGGTTWISTGNTGTTQNFTNLNSTTVFHALVQATGCSATTSGAATVTVDNPAVGGTVSTSTTVCASSNSGTLTLSGHTGSVTGWMSSNDGGATWTPISNTTTTESFLNLSDTTIYVALLISGVCPVDTSDTATVTVDPISVGGVINSSTTVCFGNNNDTLDLTGSNGVVVNWEVSTDNGISWVPISNTTTSQIYSNLTTATQFRAALQSGVCAIDYATPAIISINPIAVGGTVYGGTTVCASGNSGSLTLVGHVSGVAEWQSSTDNGTTWTSIANATAFENFSNLTQTTWYQAIVTSGVCPNDTSSIGIISVDSISVGGIVTSDDTVCANSNGDTLALSGNTGTVTGWQMSTDGGATWISLANTDSTQSYSNIAVTTQFRTSVKNGVCAVITSSAATISVDKASVAGTISSAATVCEAYNSGILTLSGTVGTILDWESSSDGGTTWTSLANTSTTQPYSNLTDTTKYRAIAQSGVCVNDTGSAVTITVIPKPVVSFTAQDTCYGIATKFTNTTTVAGGYIQLYTWDFGDNNASTTGNPVHTYSDTGTYNVTLVALSNFGCLDTGNVSVQVFGLPSVVFTTSGPLEFCEGDSVVISIPSFATNTYLWNTGDTISTVTVDTAGTWSVVVTDSLTGCINADSTSTIVNPLPVISAGADDTLDIGNSIVLQGVGNGTYSWTPVATLDIPTLQNPTATPTVTTNYTLVVTTTNGCIASDSVTIVVEYGYEFEISTVITPNGDGYNDKWFIKNLTYYPNNEVIIFNRYGQKVFGMTGYDNSWDGTFSGNNVPDGTYYYVLKFTDSDDTFTGAITVLRGSK